MRPLPTPPPPPRLTTAEDYHPGLADLLASVEVDDDDDDLDEDTMRYTKSNTRVLLQEDTKASTHLASSASLDALPAVDGAYPQDEDDGYSVQEHLPTEETHMDADGNFDLSSTARLGSNTAPKDNFDVYLEDEPTLRIQTKKSLSKTAVDPAPDIPKPKKPDDKKIPGLEPKHELSPRVKEVKALLGADKSAKYSPYELEEQHTLSQPLDVVNELRKREEEKKAAPHMAASFDLSRTLQDLSLKEVEEIPKPAAPAPAETPTPAETPAPHEPRPKPPQPPPKSALPSWVVWLVGGLLWVGVAALLLRIIYAPTPPTKDAAGQKATDTRQPKKRAFSLPRFEQIDARTKTKKPTTTRKRSKPRKPARSRRRKGRRRRKTKKRRRRKKAKRRRRRKKTKKRKRRKKTTRRRKVTKKRKPTKKRTPAKKRTPPDE